MKSWKTPTPEQVSNAVASLARREQQRYFFDRLQNPTWIRPLKDRGFFSVPPSPERDEAEGTIRFIPWPESQFLARMAPYASEEVTEIFLGLPSTDNVSVHDDIVTAASRVPQSLAAKVADQETSWVSSRPWLYGLYADKCTRLIEHLLESTETRPTALRLCSALLHLSQKGSGELIRDASAKFEDWWYEKVIGKLVEPLVRNLGVDGVAFLAQLLETALALEHRTEGEDYSYVWRPAIEDHEQNDLRRNDIPSTLVTAVRDAAVKLMQLSPRAAQQVIEDLHEKQWRALHRIAYFLARIDRNVSPALISRMLLNRTALEDPGDRHEYNALLKDRFTALSEEGQRQLLAWIREGPSYLTKKDDERNEMRLAVWQLAHLFLVRDHLGGDDRALLDRLVGKCGEPELSDFPYKLGTTWVGPTTPLSKDALAAKTDSELLDFILSWRPSGEMMSPSPEGLGRELEAVVAESPSRLWAHAAKLRQLDPTYVRAILQGLTAAAGKDASLPWKPVLDLSNWVTSKPTESSVSDRVTVEDQDEGWAASRKAVARLLRDGMRGKMNPIPFEYRESVWNVLHPITGDPDPTPAHEREFGGTNMGPTTLAINSNRGEAMNAVLGYALWVHNNAHTVGRDKSEGLALMPEVRAVLDEHLDLSVDPSVAIRSLYGEWFPWLHLIDSQWTEANLSLIFPADESGALYWEVAWNSYITHCHPYDKMLDVLRSEYGRAVERLGTIVYESDYVADPDQRLAEHLAVFLIRGKVEFEDPLIVRFYEQATPSLRAHVIEFIGRSLWEDEAPPPHIHSRMRSLWARRLAFVTRNASAPSELAAFGAWFGAKQEDASWAISELKKVLPLTTTIDLDFMVIERLARVADSMPLDAVDVLQLLAKGASNVWHVTVDRDKVRRILSAGIKVGGEACTIATEVIEHFGRAGILDFRDLLSDVKRSRN